MKILVLNSGSSSIKFKLLEMNDESTLVSGIIEEIGSEDAKVKLVNEKTGEKVKKVAHIKNHREGILIINDFLHETKIVSSLNELDGIGHRVVHAGMKFTESALITNDTIKAIEEAAELAPLHNGAALEGIKGAMSSSPDVKHVAAFDTAFHQTMPEHAYMYAIPYKFYTDYKIRRYGFHGTSHQYVSKETAKFMGIDYKNFNAITLHLGNGASMSAIKNGKCVDTTMGLTPLEGLIMGTRSGDLDPAILPYLSEKTGMSIKELDNMLNKQSGLLGLCGQSDMRKVEEKLESDHLAQLAYTMFMYRIKKYLGAYYAVLGGKVDAIIFTAGIGENAPEIREGVCEDLENLGIKINKELNKIRNSLVRYISTDNSKIKVLVVPTDEEIAIARDTVAIISK